MEKFENCEFFYARPVNKKKFKKTLEEGKDIIVDEQNLKTVKEDLKKAGYVCIREGHNMTGNNDLYQYYFEKRKD